MTERNRFGDLPAGQGGGIPAGQQPQRNRFGDARADWGGVPYRMGEAPIPKEDDFKMSWSSVVEPLLTMTTGAALEPVAGAMGLGASIIPGGRTGKEMVEDVRNKVYIPRTEGGKEGLERLANFMQPLTNIIEGSEDYLREGVGNVGEAAFGEPGRRIGGAIGATAPTLAMEVAGLGGTRRARAFARAEPSEEAAGIVRSGVEHNVPVLSTDVNPPSTFAGKWLQQLSEKMGPFGSAGARHTQQRARQEALQGYVDEMGIELETPFAETMVRSINHKAARNLQEAGRIRAGAVERLNTFGEVPLNHTLAAIDEQIQKQVALGARADESVIKLLEDTRSSIEGGNFEQLKNIRSEVISDVRAARKSEDPRSEPIYQSVKSALDKDMVSFARANDRDAARAWLRSNRAFAEQLGAIRATELKSVLSRGEATPEVVLPVLKRGRQSELQRLYDGMGDNGRAAARSAIVHDALKESGYFSGNINPDRFATAMLKPDRQAAIGVFFQDDDLKQVRGLTRLLDATRRAQQASNAPPTGVQMLPWMAVLSVGAGSAQNPFLTLSTATTLTGIAKAYESRPMRLMLMKLSQTPPGSALESSILDAAIPAVLTGLQAATRSQQQTEAKQ